MNAHPNKAGALLRQIGLVTRMQRASQRISQEAFADKIGMHRAYYGAVERGEKNAQLSTLQRVANGLGVPLSKLIAMAEDFGRTQAASPAAAAMLDKLARSFSERN